MKPVFAFAALSCIAMSTVNAVEVGLDGGSASLSFDLPILLGQSPLNSFDASFGITETRNELLALPGNNPDSAVSWNINPLGTPSPTGRLIQGTSLTIDPNNVLGTWGEVTSDAGPFVSGGEQIGFGGITRWTLDPGIPGVLLFGDWGLRYSSSRAGTLAGSTRNIRSGLVLTSNIDFPNAAFADIGNVSIAVKGNTLSITGDLLISDALIVLGFPSSNLGLDVGDFSLTATGAFASVFPNTKANGVAYLTYDRAAWATIAPSAFYTDISGNPTGASGPTADVVGQRWMMPDRFEGTSWVSAEADYPGAWLTPVPAVALTQPAGGFAMPVNTYDFNSFAPNHKITDYNSTSNPNGYIGLGGSFRVTSDFNNPGASVWWQHLAVRIDPVDSIWKIYATSGTGQGSIFELRNVIAETINGNLHLSGDYVFGNTDWLQFFQDVNGHLDTERVLGHIQIVPLPVCATDIAPFPLTDGLINVADLLGVIGSWGPCPSPCTPPSNFAVCRADLNDDCVVGVADLLAVIGAWGTCP